MKEGDEARMVDETLAAMRKHGGIYERGPDIVQPYEGGVRVMTDHWLRDWLSRRIRYYRRDQKNNSIPCNVPAKMAQAIIAKKAGRNLPVLRGVITAPTLRPDGSILDKPGYDAATELLLVAKKGEKFAPVTTAPINPAEIYRHAFKTLWHAFKDFPFVEPHDAGVMVSAILTVAVRPTLPTAPGFGMLASMPSSGKSLMASSLGQLTGCDPAPMSQVNNDDEMRKRLFTCSRNGDPFIFFDNITGIFASAVLAAFLTAKSFSDRILGVSEKESMPNNAVFVLTGNNLAFQGDLWRRILRCRIDPKTETPEEREFQTKPEIHCKEHRQEIISAALTLLHGYVRAGRPKLAKSGMGSFEDWNDLVRQCVLWIKAEGYAGDIEIGDPYEAIREAKQENPQMDIRNTIFESLGNIFPKERAFSVADAIARAIEADSVDHDPLAEPKTQLRDAFLEIALEKNGRILTDNVSRAAIGRWFSLNSERLRRGLCHQESGTREQIE